MRDYKAGNLTLELFGIDRSAEKTITNVVKKLDLLQRSLNVFQNVNATKVGKNLSDTFHNIGIALGSINENDINKLSSLAKATNYLQRFLTVVQKSDSRQVYGKLNSLFRSISSSVNSIDENTLANITAVSSALSSLGRFSTKITKLDFSKTQTGFQNLAIAIQPFLEKVREAEVGLNSLYGILQKSSGKKTQGLLGGIGKDNKNGGIFGISKLGISLYMMRRFGRFMANIVVAGSDYNETLNLWQVAMRNNLDTADQFVSKMQKAYGISTKTLMNAQAIFKNMVGALGNITDQTAYALSEALVQMSADFSSLYNVTLTEAFNKMQAMLSRQIRPIRSVSGLDISERTIYELYQGLGGTKTMRQLNNTEKQLLSILAVYRQMGASGALGDMTKTLNQFANQSRMMTEYWTELKTWTGLVLKDLIDQSGALVYINAALITVTEIMRSIARSRGLGEDNFINGLFETTEATNDAVDELQGKLLDFDKFRSLEGVIASPLAIDQKLLDAIAGYDSQIDQAQNAARKIADDWLRILGATENENGELVFTGDNLTRIENVLKGIGAIVASIIGYGIYKLLANLSTGIRHLLIPLKDLMTTTNLMYLSIGFLVASVFVFVENFDKLSTRAKVWIPILASLAGVITAVAAGLTFMKGNWIGAIGLGATVAGIGLLVGTKLAIPNYEMGASDIDSGTIFRAGEFGKTEAVYTGSNGKTNVANVQQMEQAFYNALARHSRDGNGTIVVQAYLDGEKVYENTTARAKARGKVWAKA